MDPSDDLDALLRGLRQDPERLDRLRQLLVGDALGGMAAAVRELAVAQQRTEEHLGTLTAHVDTLTQRVDALTARVEDFTERLDTLTARVDTLTQRLDTLTARVDTLTQRLDTLTERVDKLAQQMSELVEQMSRLDRRVGRLEDSTGWLVGDALERRYRERGPVYLRAIARRLRTLDVGEVDELLEQAIADGHLSEADAQQVRLADAILRGRRREDDASVYLVVEASYGVGIDDVRRAHDRAALLARTGMPSVPVVAGQWVAGPAAEAAHGMGVWQVTDGRAVAPASAHS